MEPHIVLLQFVSNIPYAWIKEYSQLDDNLYQDYMIMFISFILKTIINHEDMIVKYEDI